jgi:HD superfamily phosphohydrolase
MKHIRDPLYGYISVTEDELRVIGMPSVQRLRCVQQLGLSSAVYPGATHTRFEHSLGVMHLAGELSESLGLSHEKTQAYRLAGLLHDVGHAPFSHATEYMMEAYLGITHEEQSCRIVDAIASSLGSQFPADPSFVKDAILGNTRYDIVAGNVDVDRMDYLRRDALATGIPHGQIDTETVIRFAQRMDDDIVFSHKSLQGIEDLFSARNAMNKSIYQHHASRIVETMLQRAVEEFIEESDVPPAVIMRWDDRQLHHRLLEHVGLADDLYMVDTTPDTDTEIAPTPTIASSSLYGRVTTRDLFKQAFILGTEQVGRDGIRALETSITDIRAVEDAIASDAGVSPDTVLVDPPTIPSGKPPEVRILMNGKARAFSSLSGVPESLEKSEWATTFLCVYTAPEHRDAVADAAETQFC